MRGTRTSRAWTASAWTLIGFGIGFAVGAWQWIEVEPTVNVTDLLGVAATVALTVLVAILGQKRFSEDRAEKDILIEATKEAVAQLRATASVFQTAHVTGSNDLAATTRRLDDLGSALFELSSLLDDAGGHETAFAVSQDLYATRYPALRRLVSGGDFPAKPYPVPVYMDGKQLIGDMEGELRRLVFTINRR